MQPSAATCNLTPKFDRVIAISKPPTPLARADEVIGGCEKRGGAK